MWSKLAPEVEAVQQAVDSQRAQVVLQAGQAIFDDEQESLRYAQWGTYVLIGYQQLDGGDDVAPLEWARRRLLADGGACWR